jgi:type IV pilus assembly protein PilC
MAGSLKIGGVTVPLLSPKEIKEVANGVSQAVDTIKNGGQAPVPPGGAQPVPPANGANDAVKPNEISATDPTSGAPQAAPKPAEKKFNPVTSAFHGASYAVGVLSGNSDAFKIQKATGEALDQELAKVQAQSANYKDQGALEDQKRLEKYKNQKLTSFRYKVRDSSGKITSNTFEAPSAKDVRAFLVNEGYEVIEVKERSKYDIDIGSTGKIKTGALAFMLTQLSTYIKAGIPLINSVRILAKQATDNNQKKILNKVVYELVVGEKFSIALEKQGKAFPSFLINMVKTSEMTGDLASALDEMAEYYQEIDSSRKAMMSALIYPAVIFTAAVAAIIFIIVAVVPQFVSMFADQGAELPAITKFIIGASDFLTSYWWLLIIILVSVILIYRFLFKNIRDFRKAMQTFYMHVPVIGNIIIYNEIATFTRTFASLLSHNVYITDSMEILSKITNNEIYKEIINRTMITLSKGGKISESFKGEWAFPVVAYEMLVTGESTGQLATMMLKVAEHFTRLHTNSVTAMKSLIEPVIIMFLAVAVGFIILSIIMPMFDLYGQI